MVQAFRTDLSSQNVDAFGLSVFKHILSDIYNSRPKFCWWAYVDNKIWRVLVWWHGCLLVWACSVSVSSSSDCPWTVSDILKVYSVGVPCAEPASQAHTFHSVSAGLRWLVRANKTLISQVQQGNDFISAIFSLLQWRHHIVILCRQWFRIARLYEIKCKNDEYIDC